MFSRRDAMLGSAGLFGALASGALAVHHNAAARGGAISATRLSQRVPYGACVNLGPLEKEPEYRLALETYCQQVTPEYGFFWDVSAP